MRNLRQSARNGQAQPPALRVVGVPTPPNVTPDELASLAIVRRAVAAGMSWSEVFDRLEHPEKYGVRPRGSKGGAR